MSMYQAKKYFLHKKGDNRVRIMGETSQNGSNSYI